MNLHLLRNNIITLLLILI